MDNSVILENGEKYTILDSTTYDNNKYVLLSNVSNKNDVCIRKILNEDDKVYVCRLDDKELKEVLNLFINENKDLLTNEE